MADKQMVQYAPWPDALEEAVSELQYEPGWEFSLHHLDRDYADAARHHPIAGGLTFCIFVPCQDSYHPESRRPVMHYHPVPAATFNRAAWERWLFDRLMDTVRHEAAEWFRFVLHGDFVARESEHHDTHERRPFAPTHGPGDDPYVLHEYATDTQRRTSYRGEATDG
jgi:hypothetical protein